jgi:hypothetical protein
VRIGLEADRGPSVGFSVSQTDALLLTYRQVLDERIPKSRISVARLLVGRLIHHASGVRIVQQRTTSCAPSGSFIGAFLGGVSNLQPERCPSVALDVLSVSVLIDDERFPFRSNETSIGPNAGA